MYEFITCFCSSIQEEELLQKSYIKNIPPKDKENIIDTLVKYQLDLSKAKLASLKKKNKKLNLQPISFLFIDKIINFRKKSKNFEEEFNKILKEKDDEIYQLQFKRGIETHLLNIEIDELKKENQKIVEEKDDITFLILQNIDQKDIIIKNLQKYLGKIIREKKKLQSEIAALNIQVEFNKQENQKIVEEKDLQIINSNKMYHNVSQRFFLFREKNNKEKIELKAQIVSQQQEHEKKKNDWKNEYIYLEQKYAGRFNNLYQKYEEMEQKNENFEKENKNITDELQTKISQTENQNTFLITALPIFSILSTVFTFLIINKFKNPNKKNKHQTDFILCEV